MAVPPEIRRRAPNGARAAPGAHDAEERIRLALGKAQRKLLDSQQKLRSSVAALREQLASPR